MQAQDIELVDYRSDGILRMRVQELLADAIGEASAGKLAHVLNVTYQRDDAVLYACWCEGQIVGVIGIKRLTGYGATQILHLAVDLSWRGRGIGRNMLEQLRWIEPSRVFLAETDEDAVGFYRRCGFSVRSLGEKYPGVERFFCQRIGSYVE